MGNGGKGKMGWGPKGVLGKREKSGREKSKVAGGEEYGRREKKGVGEGR